MRPLSRRNVLRLAPAATAGALLTGYGLTGCGLSSGAALPLPVRPAGIKPMPSLRGARLIVGSKDFTEQFILAYIAEFALAAAGADVRDMSNITGSMSARNALVTEQIDMTWDYTGSSWISYNGREEPIPDPRAQFEAVRRLDHQRHDITWIAPSFEVDNTYALSMNKATAARLGVRTLSDLARLARQRPEEATFCLDSEFANRSDGWPGLLRAYDMSIPASRIQTLSSGSIPQATASGNACNFGEIFRTDGRIAALDLTLLTDDKAFFPRYNLAMTLRRETLRRYPALRELFAPISRRLDNDTLIRLNGQVDVAGRDPADVAREWMVEQGFVRLP